MAARQDAMRPTITPGSARRGADFLNYFSPFLIGSGG
jgi:hypothetical protein